MQSTCARVHSSGAFRSFFGCIPLFFSCRLPDSPCLDLERATVLGALGELLQQPLEVLLRRHLHQHRAERLLWSLLSPEEPPRLLLVESANTCVSQVAPRRKRRDQGARASLFKSYNDEHVLTASVPSVLQAVTSKAGMIAR